MVYKTLDPRFDEQLSFKAMRLERMVDKGLGMVVMDKDEGLLDADDVLGKVSVSLDCLKDADNVQFNEPLKGEKGNLIFSLEWIDARATAALEEEEGRRRRWDRLGGAANAGDARSRRDRQVAAESHVPLPPPGAGAVSDGAGRQAQEEGEEEEEEVREEAGLETPETVQQI